MPERHPLIISLTPLGLVGLLLRGKRAGLAHSVRRLPELAVPHTMSLTSPSFGHGAPIPLRHIGIRSGGTNTSPALAWQTPAGTRELLLVIEDTDAPTKRPIIHTAALIPATLSSLVEGELIGGNTRLRHIPGYRERTGYHGPGPLPGHGTHHYGFHLFALDRSVPAGIPLASIDDVLPHTQGRVLAHGLLTGTAKA